MHQFQPVLVDQVNLGDGYQAGRDLQQLQNRKVFLGLRHYPFVGGDYQKAGVYAADAGQHVLDEPLMTRERR